MKTFFRALFRGLGLFMGLDVVIYTFIKGIEPGTGPALIGATIFLLMCEIVADGI